MTSHGSLTIDCLPENGVGTTETKACHQFSCTPTGKLSSTSAHPSLRELVELVYELNTLLLYRLAKILWFKTMFTVIFRDNNSVFRQIAKIRTCSWLFVMIYYYYYHPW